jgi:uncharacterized RDD family membrane protein YckC
LDGTSADHQQPWINRSAGSPYQGVAIRFVALFIDTLIITAAMFSPVFTGAVPLIFSASVNKPLTLPLLWLLLALSAVVTFAYFTLLEGRYGQTVGKKVVHIKVVHAGNRLGEGEGAPISYIQAAQRTILRILDGQFCYLVGALLIWSPGKKQRLGDIVAHTVVVRK